MCCFGYHNPNKSDSQVSEQQTLAIDILNTNLVDERYYTSVQAILCEFTSALLDHARKRDSSHAAGKAPDLRGATSTILDSHSDEGPPGRAQGQCRGRCPQSCREGSEPSSSQEVQLGCSPPTTRCQNDWQRDHCSDDQHGSSSPGISDPSQRLRHSELRDSCQQDLCSDGKDLICPMGTHHLQGGRRSRGHHQLAPEEICSMADATADTSKDIQDARHAIEPGAIGCLLPESVSGLPVNSTAGDRRGGHAVRDGVQDSGSRESVARSSEDQEGQKVQILSEEEPPSKRVPLSATMEKNLCHLAHTDIEESWWSLVSMNRKILLEVCCDPHSVLSEQCDKHFGSGSSTRLAHWNGGDIETTEGRKFIKKVMKDEHPMAVWISPECGPYSPLQNLNKRTLKQRLDLEEKRRRARLQYEGAKEIAIEAHKLGIVFVIELSERCEGWKLSWVDELQKLVPVHFGICKGCQVNLRDPQRELLGKGWKMCSNNEELMRHMNLPCSGDHSHGKCEGASTSRSTAFYTPEFANRVIKHLKTGNHVHEIIAELTDGASSSTRPSMVDHVHEDPNPQNGNLGSFGENVHDVPYAFTMTPGETKRAMRLCSCCIRFTQPLVIVARHICEMPWNVGMPTRNSWTWWTNSLVPHVMNIKS